MMCFSIRKHCPFKLFSGNSLFFINSFRCPLKFINWFIHIIYKLLKETNCKIFSLDRLDYSGSYNRIDEIIKNNLSWKKRIKIIWHDLKAEINPIVRKELSNPDVILHVAAASHVDRSIKNPMSFVMDNVVGTVNLLNYARQNKNLKIYA